MAPKPNENSGNILADIGLNIFSKKKLKGTFKISEFKNSANKQWYNFFCIRFIGFMLTVKSLLDYINLFSPNEYDKNGKTILKYFQ